MNTAEAKVPENGDILIDPSRQLWRPGLSGAVENMAARNNHDGTPILSAAQIEQIKEESIEHIQGLFENDQPVTRKIINQTISKHMQDKMATA